MRILGGAALAAVTVLALTGCGSQSTAPSTTPTVTVAPTTVPPTSPPPPTAPETITATPGPTTTAAADPNRPKGQCPDDSLGVSIVSVDAGAGSLDSTVLFTNTGGEACELRGTPGVSVVGDGNGTQLGKPATGIQNGVVTRTLQPGATIASQLRITNIGTNGGPLPGCTVRKGDGYRVYPPHSTRAFFVQDPKAVACAPGPVFMTVGPVGAS
ncbi:MAG: DUF4232 domain-containing protein [Acidobacteria bacterium]|nr:DUF4232 domain-containing protein [Acidobacteriota bacterium]